ncbi:MAG: inner membrane CreD family protein [Spirochaetota bacterium]
MSVKQILAIGLIFLGLFAAWMILGVTDSLRTKESTGKMSAEVNNLFGGRQCISSPGFYYYEKKLRPMLNVNGLPVTNAQGAVIKEWRDEPVSIALASSDITADFHMDPRKKGLLWFPTYRVRYAAHYTARNTTSYGRQVYAKIPLGSSDVVYDAMRITVNGAVKEGYTEVLCAHIPADGIMDVSLSYTTTGTGEWFYLLNPQSSSAEEIKNFSLVMTTDFKDIDFPNGGYLSPVKKEATSTGWKLFWTYSSAVTGKNIGLSMPEKQTPGEIASRITFFAPVPMLFYFFILVILSVIMKVRLHPMNYFFIGAAFFAFNLILSYFSDQMPIGLAFAIASVVSIVLVSSYLRIFTTTLFAFVFSPLAQIVYLITFSFSFFFKGTTGFMLTIVSVITLFVLMQLTGKIDWGMVFSRPSGPSGTSE